MAKLKLAFYWAASCGGCDVSILDINERVLDVIAIADIVFWPIAVDFKYKDVEAMEDKSIDVCLFNGSIRNSEQEHIAKLLRNKSKILIAHGTCACFGGIPSLANFNKSEDAYERAYIEAQTNVNENRVFPQTFSEVPEGDLELPVYWKSVKSLEQVVPVDYFLPGCPPPVHLTNLVVDVLASGNLPPAGATIASEKSLCDECSRKRKDKKINHIYRPYEIIPDKENCLLEQGLICMGPATRGGCGQQCINTNMPCRGCFGPVPGVMDQGSKMLSALASIYEADDEEAIKKMLDEIVDPAGTFNRYVMSTSILQKKRQ